VGVINAFVAAVRNGSFEFIGISRFAQIVATTPSGPLPVAGPNTAAPEPSYLETTIQSPCRSGTCASFCDGTTSINNNVTNGICTCVSCVATTTSLRQLKQTILGNFYSFTSTACSTQTTQALANACSASLAQTITCFLLHSNEVSSTDKASLNGGAWTFRPPTITGGITAAVPQPAQFIIPSSFSCHSSGSKKGLLGLLGLLGLIPLILCCCLLLLCCLRRKRAGPEIPFATFDPVAASVIGAPGNLPQSVIGGPFGLPQGPPGVVTIDGCQPSPLVF